MVMDFISIAGFILTIAGLGIAIWQITEAKESAESAATAAKETQEAIKRNVALADITICIKTIEEIQNYLRNGAFHPAIIRTTDLCGELIQLRHLQNDTTNVNFKSSLTQLSIMQELLEKKIKDVNHDFDVMSCNKQLSKISRQLNDWLGREKFSIVKGV